MPDPEIVDLPAAAAEDITDDDLILIYDNGAASNKSRKATRGDFLKDVARQDGDHNFGTTEIEDLTAERATLTEATVVNGLSFEQAATLNKLWAGNVTLSTAGTAPGASETLTGTVQGISVADFLSLSFTEGLADGLVANAWISADNTISVKFYNTSAGAIAGKDYTARCLVANVS